MAASAVRPSGRRAKPLILRRLLSRQGSLVPPELLVRLWRNILARSAQNQADITIHVSKKLNATMGLRLRIRDYFGTLPVEEYRDEGQALMQVNTSLGDICIVETESPWVEAFVEGKGGQAKVVACLPFLRDDTVPKLLVFGHAPSEPTGDDETLDHQRRQTAAGFFAVHRCGRSSWGSGGCRACRVSCLITKARWWASTAPMPCSA